MATATATSSTQAQEQEKPVEKANLRELGSMLVNGLPFVDGDLEAAMKVVISKNAGKKVVLSPPHKTEEGEEVPEESLIVSEEARDELLGAIAELSELRSRFVGEVAEAVNEHREDSEEYAKLLANFRRARTNMENAQQEIYEYDSDAMPGFEISNFVIWSAEGQVIPKPMASSSNGSRSRRATRAKWSLSEYACSQDEVSGDLGTFRNPILRRQDGKWAVYSDDGFLLQEDSPNKAMVALLESAGLSGKRSSVAFWNAVEQEQEAGVS